MSVKKRPVSTEESKLDASGLLIMRIFGNVTTERKPPKFSLVDQLQIQNLLKDGAEDTCGAV